MGEGLFQCSRSISKTRAGRKERTDEARDRRGPGNGRETINNRRWADERWTGSRAFSSQLKYQEGVGCARSRGSSEWLRESRAIWMIARGPGAHRKKKAG